MERTYYAPVQVRFKCDSSISGTKGWDYGIAFRRSIICACCGGVFDIEDCKVIEENVEWSDLTSGIRDDFVSENEEDGEKNDAESQNNL